MILEMKPLEEKEHRCRAIVEDGILVVRFPDVFDTLSWAPYNNGAHPASAVLNMQVPDDGSGHDFFDAIDFNKECLNRGLPDDSIGMMTAALVDDFMECLLTSGKFWVHAFATVGLTNARSVRDSADVALKSEVRTPGTINIIVATNALPDMSGRLESLHVVSAAKTAALRDAEIKSRKSEQYADLTGTDSIVIASSGEINDNHSGLHTVPGDLMGSAVHDVVTRGIHRYLGSE